MGRASKAPIVTRRRGGRSSWRPCLYAATVALMAGVAGCQFGDQDPPSFRLHNMSGDDLEFATGDGNFEAIAAGDSEVISTVERCEVRGELIVREPGADIIDRIATETVCGESPVYYHGPGDITLEP